MSTLIIGSRCSDGIVLAADRRELRGYEPVQQIKIRQIDIQVEGMKGVILLAGAGVAAFWDEVAWSVPHSLQEGEQRIKTLLDVVDRVSSISINISARYQRDGLDERLGCVVAGLEGLTNGRAQMYYFAGAGFSLTEFICLGSGESYALPLADLLLKERELSVDDVAQYVPVLFLLVERVNVSVEGGPDIFVLRDDQKVMRMTDSQVEATKVKACELLKSLPKAFLKLVQDPTLLHRSP